MKNIKNEVEIDETLKLLSEINTSDKRREGKFIQKAKEKLERGNPLKNKTPAEEIYSLLEIDNNPNIPTMDCTQAFEYIKKRNKNYNPNTPIGGFRE